MRRAPSTVSFASVALAALLGIAQPALAEPGGASTSDADRARARELMRAGNELYGKGQLSEAYAKYLEAWRTSQAFDIACNLGGTASELTLHRDAAEYLDYCLRHYAASSRPESVAAERRARAAFEVVKGKVAAVTVKVTPAGAEVLVDGASVGRAPLDAPVFLEAGPHRIEARQMGLEPAKADVQAVRGQATETSLELKPASGAAPIAEAPPPATGSPTVGKPVPDEALQKPSYVPAIVTASIGGAALVTGVVFLVVRSGKQSDASDTLDKLPGKNPCGTGSTNTSECGKVADLTDQAATFGTLSLVSFGVAAGAGVATFFLWPTSTQEAGLGGIRPTVAGSNEGVYASVSGRF